jgi:ABC-type antimicrobial peptide transport system permease subunit
MGGEGAAQTPWLTIVGVAQETNYSLWDEYLQPAVYLSNAQLPNEEVFFALRTDGDPMALAAPVRKTLAGLDAALPLDGIQTWQQGLHEQLTGLIDAAAMMGIDALIALLLAAIGIFAVMANQVGERTREIGVRLAMGARRQDVMGMILRRAGWLTGTGICIGLAMAFALAHGVASLLRGVRPNDPAVFAVITTLIAAVAVGSSWIPARRAARIEPMEALRDE